MKNNKGMTIVELIVCLILVSVMMIFLLNLLITVQNFSVQNQNVTDLLVNQSVVIKALEKDMNEYKLKGVSTCTAEDLSQDKRYPIVSNDYSNLYCLKLTYDNSLLEENVGYLVQYTYNYTEFESKNVVGYKRGSNQTIRESKISMDPNNYLGYVTTSCKNVSSSSCSLKITMPIFDEIGTNYDIVATYIYNSSDFNYQPGSAYGFVINEGASPTPGENPEEPEEPDDSTLSGSIRINCSLEDPLTKPGTEIATTDEGTHLTEDDYGLSCYYRGAVKNNYLVFANKCWRIVRITGNGDIKLILWNNNGASCTSTNAAGKSAFTSEANDSSCGFSQSCTTYAVSYMYGIKDCNYINDSPTYYSNNNTGILDNVNDSTILTNLKNWYDTAFQTSTTNKYTNLLADVIWCNDKSFDDEHSNFKGTQFGSVIFQSVNRLALEYFNSNELVNKTATPSLVCPNTGLNGKASKYTSNDISKGNGALKGYKLGLITADEVAFAGGAYHIDNSLYYLYDNNYYFTLTPVRGGHIAYPSSPASMWLVNNSGSITFSSVASEVGLRPSIALKSTVTATGSGTATDPYVVTSSPTASKPTVKISAYKFDSGKANQAGDIVVSEKTYNSDNTFIVSEDWLNYGITFKMEQDSSAGIKSIIWKWNNEGSATDTGNTYSNENAVNQTSPFDTKYASLTGAGYRKGQWIVTGNDGGEITITVVVKIDSCNNVRYQNGTKCSNTCGSGTYNRLAYSTLSGNRCSAQDKTSGGSSCTSNTGCTTTSNCNYDGSNAELLTGSQFNSKIVKLAGSNLSVGRIKRSNTLQSGLTSDNIISTSNSCQPVYAWFADARVENGINVGTIYYYSNANKIYMNSNSTTMFARLTNLIDISGVSGFDASKVTNMTEMFVDDIAYNLDISPISSWNVSNVTNMNGVFRGVTYLKDLSALSNWNVSKVTNMSQLFMGTSITNLDSLKKWNVSKVTNMSYMFSGTLYLSSISGVSNWDVSNVTNMSFMFQQAGGQNASLTESYWVTDVNSINNWNINRNANFSRMFYISMNRPTFTKVPGTWDDYGTFVPN